MCSACGNPSRPTEEEATEIATLMGNELLHWLVKTRMVGHTRPQNTRVYMHTQQNLSPTDNQPRRWMIDIFDWIISGTMTPELDSLLNVWADVLGDGISVRIAEAQE